MDAILRCVCMCLAMFLLQQASAFENLDFEDSMPIPGEEFSQSALVPGWHMLSAVDLSQTIYSEPELSVFFLNYWHVGLDSYYVLLGDPETPISGDYSFYIDTRLYEFTEFFQEGNVPVGSQSISFTTNFTHYNYYLEGATEDSAFNAPASELDLYLNDEKLALIELGDFGSHRRFGANIPSYLAGSEAKLKFSLELQEILVIDDVEFSPLRIPEPSASALLILACGFYYRRRFYSR